MYYKNELWNLQIRARNLVRLCCLDVVALVWCFCTIQTERNRLKLPDISHHRQSKQGKPIWKGNLQSTVDQPPKTKEKDCHLWSSVSTICSVEATSLPHRWPMVIELKLKKSVRFLNCLTRTSLRKTDRWVRVVMVTLRRDESLGNLLAAVINLDNVHKLYYLPALLGRSNQFSNSYPLGIVEFLLDVSRQFSRLNFPTNTEDFEGSTDTAIKHKFDVNGCQHIHFVEVEDVEQNYITSKIHLILSSSLVSQNMAIPENS